MTSTTGITAPVLPATIATMLASADESETVLAPGGDAEVTFARFGSLQVAVTTDGKLVWHDHDDETVARECYAANVAEAKALRDYMAQGGNVQAWALHARIGVPLEMAEQLVGMLPTEQEQEPAVPVRAIGRAPVPPAGTVYEAAAEPRTGMYL